MDFLNEIITYLSKDSLTWKKSDFDEHLDDNNYRPITVVHMWSSKLLRNDRKRVNHNNDDIGKDHHHQHIIFAGTGHPQPQTRAQMEGPVLYTRPPHEWCLRQKNRPSPTRM
ncbi:24290_t:CDS:2, partial [Gigaspora rosea]